MKLSENPGGQHARLSGISLLLLLQIIVFFPRPAVAGVVGAVSAAVTDRAQNLARGCTGKLLEQCHAARVIDGNGRNGVLNLQPIPSPLRVAGAYRVIETYPTTLAHDLIIEGLTGEDVQRSGIRLRGHLENITIRNSSFSFREQPQTSPHLPACIEAGDKQDSQIVGLLIQNVTCSGFQMTMAPERYWNGDGLVVERNVSDLVIDNFVSRNSTDGCADIKPVFRATSMTLGGCKLLLRSWRGGEIDALTLETPIKRGGTGVAGGVWLKGNPAAPPKLYIKRLVVRFRAPGPIFIVQDGPADIRVDVCDIVAPTGTKWAIAGNPMMRWTLGPTCRL